MAHKKVLLDLNIINAVLITVQKKNCTPNSIIIVSLKNYTNIYQSTDKELTSFKYTDILTLRFKCLSTLKTHYCMAGQGQYMEYCTNFITYT